MLQDKLSPTATVYCVDSSALIDINRIYPERNSFFTNIWKKLDDLIDDARIIAPLEVYEEIKVHEDEIFNWCKDRKKRIFFDVEDELEDMVKIVHAKYDPAHLATMTSFTGRWADPWVIALSKVHSATIVSSEKVRPNSIPFVAKIVEVKCVNVLGFFDEIQPTK